MMFLVALLKENVSVPLRVKTSPSLPIVCSSDYNTKTRCIRIGNWSIMISLSFLHDVWNIMLSGRAGWVLAIARFLHCSVHVHCLDLAIVVCGINTCSESKRKNENAQMDEVDLFHVSPFRQSITVEWTETNDICKAFVHNFTAYIPKELWVRSQSTKLPRPYISLGRPWLTPSHRQVNIVTFPGSPCSLHVAMEARLQTHRFQSHAPKTRRKRQWHKLIWRNRHQAKVSMAGQLDSNQKPITMALQLPILCTWIKHTLAAQANHVAWRLRSLTKHLRNLGSLEMKKHSQQTVLSSWHNCIYVAVIAFCWSAFSSGYSRSTCSIYFDSPHGSRKSCSKRPVVCGGWIGLERQHFAVLAVRHKTLGSIEQL